MYDVLAGVYEFLVADELVTPEGMADAVAPLLADLPQGARVLDCACGTGTLAAGLAERGLDVAASDASPAMVARARALGVPAQVRRWEELEPGDHDAVLCAGNSLVHARDRRAALAGMARALRPGGLLVVTSRGWEALRARRPRLELSERLVRRGDRTAVVARAWHVPDAWEDEHAMDVAVGVLGADGAIATTAERLTLWPFRHEQLLGDLRATGLSVVTDTWTPDAPRYAVTARRARPTAPARAAS